MRSPQGKIALVTGGASGIGLAMVKKLLEHGAKGVAIVDVSEEAGQQAVLELNRVFGDNKNIFLKADVTINQELEGAFEKTIQKYNQLDIVVNNAGIVDEILWEKTISVNLVAVVSGTYLAMQKYLPKYKSGEEGVIVNTASVLGFQATPTLPIYCTTKHALIGFGKALGGTEFYNKYKVRVLTICPGLVETPLFQVPSGKTLFPEIRQREINTLKLVPESPESVGQALIDMIKNGKHGSLWVTEYDQPAYEVVAPLPQAMKVLQK